MAEHIEEGRFKSIELNASPYRLDIDYRLCKYAKLMGVPVAISPDAHSIRGLADIQYGVMTARKGWLEPKEFEALHAALAGCGLPVWHPLLNQIGSNGGRQLMDGLEEFREHLGGELCLTFPDGLGRRQDLHQLDEAVLASCMDDLASRVHHHAAQQ